MRVIKITVEYDGTLFHGWQIQSKARSVQGELRKAIRQITGETVSVEGAGRTDSGVHARGQVASCRIENPIGLAQLHKGLNAVLPVDVRIKRVELADDGFHARHSATERRYRYTIARQPVAMNRQFCWFYPHSLDLTAIRQASELILGEHSFRSFCLTHAEVKNYVCCVSKADWHEQEPFLVFSIHANRFLHNMVRSLVGTLVKVGRGNLTVMDFDRIMRKEDRRLAGFTAPACGLVLEEVIY